MSDVVQTEGVPGPARELTAEEQQLIAQQQIEQIMRQPVPLPIQYSLTSMNLPNGEAAVLTEFRTPTGVTRLVWPREAGLAFVSQMKKQLQTGPSQLVLPPSAAGEGGLAVPQ